MENLRVTSMGRFEDLVSRSTHPKVIEEWPDIQGSFYVVELESGFPETSVYFRSEEDVRLTLDTRVPKPQELYRNVAFYRIDNILGWKVSAPYVPWQLDSRKKGTIRPYWKEVEVKEDYQLRGEILRNKNFWEKVAIEDYIFGVTDRCSNDALYVNGEPILTDNGLSFVEGLDFTTQKNFVRDILKGEKVPEDDLDDLRLLNTARISSKTQGLIDPVQVEWVMRRTKRIIRAGVVI